MSEALTITPDIEFTPIDGVALQEMAQLDSATTLLDVLGVEADSLPQPKTHKEAVMTTTQTVGPNDGDDEVGQ